MERTIKLSPAMQAGLWHKAGVDMYDPNVPADLRSAWSHRTTKTLAGLLRRSLVSMGEFTDAGRAWIAEQIEAAHVEALDEDRLRETIALHREVGATYATDRQWNIARSLEIIAMPREMDSKRTDVA